MSASESSVKLSAKSHRGDNMPTIVVLGSHVVWTISKADLYKFASSIAKSSYIDPCPIRDTEEAVNLVFGSSVSWREYRGKLAKMKSYME